MNINRKISATFTLLLLTMHAGPNVFAESAIFDEHFEAQIISTDTTASGGAHGYVNLLTDSSGKGIVNVMFSSSDKSHGARLHTRIRFYNNQGKLVHQKVIKYDLPKADAQGILERKLTHFVNAGNFDSATVEFYSRTYSDFFSANSGPHQIIQANRM